MAATASVIENERDISKAASLLHSLVPRAQVFCFYDRDAVCTWSSDSADDYEIDNFVAELPREVIDNLVHDSDVLRRTLSSGRTILALPVPNQEDGIYGLLIALFSKNDGKSSSFSPSLLKSILDPAIDMIAESLRVRSQNQDLQRSLANIEKELEFVYEVDKQLHSRSERHTSMAQLVGRSGRYLGINYSVLLIPSKRIRISATHASWKNVNRKVLDRYLIDQLLPKLEGQRKPVIFEVPADDEAGAAETGYQALLCPVMDAQGNIEGILAQLGRVSGKKFNKQNRRFMSHIARQVEYVIEQSFDVMTGLMSRAGFEAQLRESYNSLKSASDTHQLIYIDLDNLQLVNDTFDRKAGDDVISTFARLLEEDLPRSAVLSRLTGDDFCMLLTHVSSDEALEYANKLRDRASALRYLEGDKSLQVTMSIGIAEFDRSSGVDGQVLTTARMACEAAKEHGRDRIEIYDEGNRSVIRRYDDMQLVAEIQQALDGDLLELYAQPIARLSDKAANPRYEVLLRMPDSKGGRIPSSAFFSAAERYGLMPQIDRWVVSNLLSKLGKVSESVIACEANFAINLSGQSLSDDDFLEFIEREIDDSKIPNERLCFEITESAAVSNLRKAKSFISELRKRGCKISLDDFGAGLSSFAYLKSFDVDTLKIDGGFIRDIAANRISESMVTAITQVAKVMKLETVAEYVETDEALELIRKIGVDYAQGHLISKPVTLTDVLSDLGNFKS